jgi:rubrerythrin
MATETRDLLDIALDREIVSEAFYIAGQKKTTDPGAIQLMRELAEEEAKHYRWIKNLKDRGSEKETRNSKKLPDLMIGEYLTDARISEGAGLQEVITTALKRELSSVEFYTKIKMDMGTRAGKQLCQRLVQAERNHKAKLEIFYDDLFNQED